MDLVLYHGSSDSVVVTGFTSSTGFPATPGAYDTSFNGGEQDGFVAKLSSSGNALLWSTFLGGTDGERSTGLALDQADAPVVTGSTESADFPTTPGAYDTSFNGNGYDAYVTKNLQQWDHAPLEHVPGVSLLMMRPEHTRIAKDERHNFQQNKLGCGSAALGTST